MATKKDDKAKTEKVKVEETRTEEDTGADKKKTKKIADKLKAMGVMGSRKNPVETGSNKMMTFMMVLIVAVPVSAIVAYIAIPQQLNEFLSSSSSVGNNGFNNFPGYQQAPVNPPVQRMNRTQQPDWLVQRRAEMEKRRAEFKKQNADNFATNRHPSEPPQWVKDHQALMQKEQEKHQQQWGKRSSGMPYNRAQNQSAYMANPNMNMYQSNQNPTNVYAQNPVPHYNGYVQPANPYYYNNAPYPGSYNAPYGQPGYPSYR